ncbi:SEC-C domain-containing protein [Anaerobacillus sp. CMMVII]|uniref:YecA family protein n=1 Tax=Anaerobacillus sp. CMMVII TaxID=2755588 RepID=UPI0021B7803A|nr:SEC-C metal-binding domain-containing protein [Anaerobacillus sp. CMMVII]MCT8137844.1 SEC-C domain-containing protein [Anaerobacillus sp. CMMVII]
MDSSSLIEKVEGLTKEEFDVLHFLDVITFASDYYEQVSLNYTGLKDHRVFDQKKLIEEHKMRASLDYYSFTKAQLLAAGQPDYVEKNHAMKDLLDFLKYYYEMNNENLDEIAWQLVTMINKDAQPAMAIQYLQSWIEIPSMDFLQELTGKVMNVYNNTRLWVLKGHTPHEVSQIGQKQLQPLAKVAFPIAAKAGKVVPMSNYTKTGRNNPCPCGSGKKHKNCCLK